MIPPQPKHLLNASQHLCADDEPALLNALVKRLSKGQHKVRASMSGDELLAAVEPDAPDLVFIEMKMSGRFQVPSATGEYGVTAEREHVKKNHGDRRYGHASATDCIARNSNRRWQSAVSCQAVWS